jgi:hypothetical protein
MSMFDVVAADVCGIMSLFVTFRTFMLIECDILVTTSCRMRHASIARFDANINILIKKGANSLFQHENTKRIGYQFGSH